MVEPEMVTLTKECSAMIQNTMPEKLDDPGGFCIPCQVGQKKFLALCDLGSSVSVIPTSVCKTLTVGELHPTSLMLQLADRTIRHPTGIMHDVLVSVDRFAYPVDFVVLDMEDQSEAIILGRPFLATAGALIDVKEAKLTLNVGKDQVVFDMKHATVMPHRREQCSRIDAIDKCVMEIHEISPGELKQKHYAREEERIVDFYLLEKIEEEEESPVSTRAMKEAVSIEMKPLPAHLQYQFIDDDEKFPVIVSASLIDVELKGLLAVLKKQRSDQILIG
jgi:hypothetical protein